MSLVCRNIYKPKQRPEAKTKPLKFRFTSALKLISEISLCIFDLSYPKTEPKTFFRVDLKLNGGTVLSIGGQNESSASNSVLLQLEERDRVWVELIEGRLVEPHPDSAITSFLGYRQVFT